MRTNRLAYLALVILIVAATITACGATPTATPVPPTATPVPPTKAPVVAPTNTPVPVPPTATAVPPTPVPPTATKPPVPTNTAVPAAPTNTPVPAPTASPTPLPPAKCDKLPGALSPKAGELGAPDNPIIITFVPSVDVGKITIGGQAVADCIGKMTGLTYKIQVGTSEGASIEALGGGKAQISFLNTFSVLLAKQKYDIEVALVAGRYYGILGKDGKYTAFDFDPDKAMAGQMTSFYKPEYFTRAGTGIKTLTDAKGHTFCFTSASSTSGGIIPRASFAALGIDPDKDLKSTYAGGHDKAAIAVYQGDCDAGVAFMDILTDAPTNLAAKFPDIATKVQVFAVGDRIPNDGVQYIKTLDPKIKAITTEALLAMMADKGGNAAVYSIYAYASFEKADYATYYAPFEAMLKKAGVDVSKLVKQ
jgi:phosphonate transport system substrate-binding protein